MRPRVDEWFSVLYLESLSRRQIVLFFRDVRPQIAAIAPEYLGITRSLSLDRGHGKRAITPMIVLYAFPGSAVQHS